jgi:hypothetical protein
MNPGESRLNQTRRTTSMRVLLIHTDEALRTILSRCIEDFLSERLGQSVQVMVEERQRLNHQRLATLLEETLECIILNLRLPGLLSIRLAELVHVARIPTRLVLLTVACANLERAVPLDHALFKSPVAETFLRELEKVLTRTPWRQRRGLPNQEHLDASILDLVGRYSWGASPQF